MYVVASASPNPRWTVPPSRIATATSRMRPPPAGGALVPVVSTSTTANRQCSRGSGGIAALEVIAPERQRHAPGAAAPPHQLASLHGDHGACTATVVEGLLA